MSFQNAGGISHLDKDYDYEKDENSDLINISN